MMRSFRLVLVLLCAGLVAGCQTTNSGNLIVTAERYKGTNPTGYSIDWCADFMNFVLKQNGEQGTNSRAALSFLHWGRRAPPDCTNCFAIFARGRSGRKGHVGIVVARDEKGNPIIISGNHNNTVAEGTYPKGRVIGYRYPAADRQFAEGSALSSNY